MSGNGKVLILNFLESVTKNIINPNISSFIANFYCTVFFHTRTFLKLYCVKFQAFKSV